MFRWMKKKYRSKENISKEELNAIMNNNQNVVLLDVRSPQEYDEEHLPNAINIPTYEIYQKAQKIIKDKETTIICYCTIGVRSKKAIKMLRKMGYKNLYNLENGM